MYKYLILMMTTLCMLAGQLQAQAPVPDPTARKGANITVTLNNIPPDDKATINTTYTVDSRDGTVKLPYLKSRVYVAGKTQREIANLIEKLYIQQKIYNQPIVAIQVGADLHADLTKRTVQVTGYVGNKQNLPYRQGMSLIEALLACGDITDYGSRNIQVTRKGQTRTYDYFSARDRSIVLHPNDSIHVPMRSFTEGRPKGIGP